MSHKPGDRLPLLPARPAVRPTHATLIRAATSFAAWWTEAQWVWAVCLRLLTDSVAAVIWTRALLRLSPARWPLGYCSAVCIDVGNPENIASVYSGTSTDFTNTDPVIYRPPLSRRPAESGGGRVPDYRLLRTEQDSRWLNGQCVWKIFISRKWMHPVAKQTENNKLTNLTVNINSQHIQHDEVGNTWNYTEQNSLWLHSVILYNYLNLEIAWHTALSDAQYLK